MLLNAKKCKKKNPSKAHSKSYKKLQQPHPTHGLRFMPRMESFVVEAGSAIDLVQLATDIESRETYRLSPPGIRVLIIDVPCI
jgi:hypothetical protein